MTATHADAGRVNILLVDDQPARLLSYRAVLEPLDENLIEARSGTEALRLLMEMEFAVILLDVNMPGMDGFETATLVHQHPRFERTPIIFVSAINVTDFDRLRGYKLGAVDYVLVPVIPEILRSKVVVLVELFRKRRELQALNSTLAGANSDLAAANEALRVEKARELEHLNRNLLLANAELASINANLQQEIRERANAEERLREADRRKDEFLATLAHELRNPLAPMQNALNIRRLARESGMPDAELQNIMERQMRQLVRLIDDLLDVSRITRDRLALRPERCELKTVIAAAVETARPLIAAAGHDVSIELPNGPLYLDADPQRLSQVFANLLNNSAKYTDPGGRIVVTADVDGELLRVAVRDNGIGIDESMLPHVFDLFSQVDTSLERSRGGLGIGLTLVKRLVELHGGRVEARSDGLGHGCTFVVELPYVAIEGRRDADLPADAQPVLSRVRALVVDDNRDAADTLALSLEVIGHAVARSYDPLKVLDLGRDFAPDIVFLDVGMPKLNGYELARLIRAETWGRRARLVALTGWGQEEDRRRSFDAGFDIHLVKPADLETIERVCRLDVAL